MTRARARRPLHATDDRHRPEPARVCPALGSPPLMPPRCRRVRAKRRRLLLHLGLSADRALALEDDNDCVVVGGEILANRGASVKSDFDHCDTHETFPSAPSPRPMRRRKPEPPRRVVAAREQHRRPDPGSAARSFVGRRQIDPELEAVNCDAFGGDFIMDQSAAGGRLLHVAWPIVPPAPDYRSDRCGPRRHRSRSRSLGAGACRKRRAGTNPRSAPRTDPWLRNPPASPPASVA